MTDYYPSLDETGRSFVRGACGMPKYARVYDGRCLSLTGELRDIRTSLGKRFNYEELMSS